MIPDRVRRGRCLVCRSEFDQPATGRRRKYCSDAHRVQAHYWRNRPREQAFQSIIRETPPSLAGCYVEKIKTADAKALILRYEWLGTMPGRVAACYGLKTATGALLGVTVFGWTMSDQARWICGKENKKLAICLERGACVPDAPPNAASFLISRAVKMASEDFGWHIFFAYSDPEAGEAGVIYQALNWLRIQDSAAVENYRMPDGKLISERALRGQNVVRRTRAEVIEQGAEVIKRAPKRKYVHFEGTRNTRRALRAALRYEIQS